jgi:hypothetical protein
MGIFLSRRIRFSNWDPKRETETLWGNFFTNLIDADGGESKEEELVHAGNEDSPNKTEDPSTEGRRRHRGIICVGNRRTDFWIRGFILNHRGRWVKIWVIVVIDSNVLSAARPGMSATFFFPIQLEEIEKKSITDQGITLMIRVRGMVIHLSRPLLFICQ